MSNALGWDAAGTPRADRQSARSEEKEIKTEMPIILLLLMIVVIVVLFFITANVLGVILTLFIAGLVGALADAVVPGRLPWGWLGAILAGLVGGWIGTAIMGNVGPVIAGVAILPAFIGAMILAFIVSLVFKQTGARRGY